MHYALRLRCLRSETVRISAEPAIASSRSEAKMPTSAPVGMTLLRSLWNSTVRSWERIPAVELLQVIVNSCPLHNGTVL